MKLSYKTSPKYQNTERKDQIFVSFTLFLLFCFSFFIEINFFLLFRSFHSISWKCFPVLLTFAFFFYLVLFFSFTSTKVRLMRLSVHVDNSFTRIPFVCDGCKKKKEKRFSVRIVMFHSYFCCCITIFRFCLIIMHVLFSSDVVSSAIWHEYSGYLFIIVKYIFHFLSFSLCLWARKMNGKKKKKMLYSLPLFFLFYSIIFQLVLSFLFTHLMFPATEKKISRHFIYLSLCIFLCFIFINFPWKILFSLGVCVFLCICITAVKHSVLFYFVVHFSCWVN